jgi:hypothetical protein
MMPQQAMVAGDAVVRTLYRVFVSHRNMLEWQTASQVERSSTGSRGGVWARMWPAVALAVVGLVPMWATTLARHASFGELSLLVILTACWVIAPEMAHQISRPIVRGDLALTTAERAEALRFAKAHWTFIETYANASTHWLVPDNLQETPQPVIANRTSPTNIGLQLLCTVSAHDLGFITAEEMLERLEHAVASMDGMAKLRGHLMNWYDLSDLRVLDPPYVSAVDSGNLAPTDSIDRLGAEALWIGGPWSVQAEYLDARVKLQNGRPSYHADGYYALASWVLTGESRGYANGNVGDVKPKGAACAVELAVRYSELNLDDAPVRGGKERNWTVGAN